MKKIFTLVLVMILGAVSIAGCGNTNDDSNAANADTDNAVTYQIGVLQYASHSALDASNKGFCDALEASGLNINIEQQNAQSDQSACQTIATKFVSDKKDLVLAIATPAAQSVAGATTDIPVIATAITDFVEAGLADSIEVPGGNVTGTSDLTPVAEQIDLLHKLLPDAARIGILYCSAEVNSRIQADMAVEACEALGLKATVYTVASSNEIQTVVESMVGKEDAIYTPTDNIIAAGMSTVGMVAMDNNLPVICGEYDMALRGGVATYSIDYYQLGYMAGEMAVSILKGETTPGETAIGYMDADRCELYINEENAAALNIDVSVLD